MTRENQWERRQLQGSPELFFNSVMCIPKEKSSGDEIAAESEIKSLLMRAMLSSESFN